VSNKGDTPWEDFRQNCCILIIIIKKNQLEIHYFCERHLFKYGVMLANEEGPCWCYSKFYPLLSLLFLKKELEVKLEWRCLLSHRNKAGWKYVCMYEDKEKRKRKEPELKGK